MENIKTSRARDFESRPITASAKSSVSEVIGLLKNGNVNEVFVEDGKKLSMITIRDILKASDVSNMKALALAFSVSKLSPNDTVSKASRLMNDFRLRALPIAEGKTIEGAITARSLCEALLSVKEFGNIAISKLMKRNVITVDKEDLISKARNLMVKNGVDHLPVTNSGKLCGVLTSSQIVFSMLPKEKLRQGTFYIEPAGYSDLKVSGLMDPNPLVCEPEEKALKVLKNMMEQRKTYSLVGLWDEIQGIVTYRDFVALLAEPEELEAPVYILGLPKDPFESQLAQMKFIKEAKILLKSFLDIKEIRAAIKTKEVQSERRRYEVKVSITRAGKIQAYSEEGWDLPMIFDAIGKKMKRLLTKKTDRKGRETIRKGT